MKNSRMLWSFKSFRNWVRRITPKVKKDINTGLTILNILADLMDPKFGPRTDAEDNKNFRRLQKNEEEKKN